MMPLEWIFTVILYDIFLLLESCVHVFLIHLSHYLPTKTMCLALCNLIHLVHCITKQRINFKHIYVKRHVINWSFSFVTCSWVMKHHFIRRFRETGYSWNFVNFSVQAQKMVGNILNFTGVICLCFQLLNVL